jgi:hypothetical protein
MQSRLREGATHEIRIVFSVRRLAGFVVLEHNFMLGIARLLTLDKRFGMGNGA